MSQTRLNKILADHGDCSRRGADPLIQKGSVTENGRRASVGAKVEDGDLVSVLGQEIEGEPQKVYLAFHKPVGLLTTTDTTKPDNVISFLNYPERVFPIGRLDVESSGLLLLTNDGALANALMHPRYEHEKEYEVTVREILRDADLETMRKGGMKLVEEKSTRPTRITRLSSKRFRMVLTEGQNRQIRRMCQALGYHVTSLARVRVMNVHLGRLKEGGFRNIVGPELNQLLRAMDESPITDSAKV